MSDTKYLRHCWTGEVREAEEWAAEARRYGVRDRWFGSLDECLTPVHWDEDTQTWVEED